MSDHHKMGHLQSMKVYLSVFGGLLFLTLATFWVARLDFGGLGNELAAMGIAAAKATLVTLFFMHGKYENKVTLAFVIYPAVLLVILIGGLFMDYINRDLPGGKSHGLYIVTQEELLKRGEAHGAEEAHEATGHEETVHEATGEEHATPEQQHAEPAGEAHENTETVEPAAEAPAAGEAPQH